MTESQRVIDPWVNDYLSYREAANWVAFGEISDDDLASTAELQWRRQDLEHLRALAAGTPLATPQLRGKRADYGEPVQIELAAGTIYMGSTPEFDDLCQEFEATSARVTHLLAEFAKTPSELVSETQGSIEELQQRIKKFEAALLEIVEGQASGKLQTRQLPDVGVYRNRESPDWRLARALPGAPPGWFATAEVFALFPGRSVGEDSAKPPVAQARLEKAWRIYVAGIPTDVTPLKECSRQAMLSEFPGHYMSERQFDALHASNLTPKHWKKGGRRPN